MFSLKKLFIISAISIVKGLTNPSCNTCTHYSNKKCFYYKVLLGKYVVPLYDQIMEQDFATKNTALDVYTARNDSRFCGPTGKNYQEEKTKH